MMGADFLFPEKSQGCTRGGTMVWFSGDRAGFPAQTTRFAPCAVRSHEPASPGKTNRYQVVPVALPRSLSCGGRFAREEEFIQ